MTGAVTHTESFAKDYTIVGATIFLKRRYGKTVARQELNITVKPGTYVRVLEVDLEGGA